MQTAFVRQHGALINEHHLVVEPQVAHGVRIGVVLVLLRESELLVHVAEHVGYRGVGFGLHEHRQGVHHHRDSAQGAAVAAPPESRAVRGFLLGAVGSQQLRKSRLHDHALLGAETLLDGLYLVLADAQREHLVFNG